MGYPKFKPAPQLTDADIMRIAQSKGSFTTSMRYRDEKLDRKCLGLVKQGKLKRSKHFDHYNNREYVYVKPLKVEKESPAPMVAPS